MDFSTLDIQKYIDMGVALVIGYTPKLILAVLTFIFGLIIIKQLTKGLKKIFTHQKLEPSLAGFLYSLISIGLKVLLFITVAGDRKSVV